MAFRPYWSGQIRLSLVSLPVNIYPALSRSRQIALHEIYRKTGERVLLVNDSLWVTYCRFNPGNAP